MNQSVLAKLSPLSQSAISNIANWKYNTTLSRDKCEKFGAWYNNYKMEMRQTAELSFDSTKESRLTFHPEYEIPLLRKWYNLNKTPSDEKLYFYAKELNKGCVRQERPMVTVAKLKNWWKNERQREKRISCQVNRLHEIDQTDDDNLNESDSCTSQTLRSSKRLQGEKVKGKRSYTESEAGQDERAREADVNVTSPIHSESTSVSSHSQNVHTVPYMGVHILGTSHIAGPKVTQTMQSVPYSNVNVLGTSQPPGFVSLLQSASVPNDIENGNQVILSDGTVVRPVPLFQTPGIKNENQSIAGHSGSSLHGTNINVVRTGNNWNQSSPRVQDFDHPGAPRPTQDKHHPWS